MLVQIRGLNTGALACHEGHQLLEIKEVWHQQPYRQLKRAVLPSFAEEDYPSTIHEGLKHWPQGPEKFGRIPQALCKMLGLDANLLPALIMEATIGGMRPGIH